jgi:PLP dependent protein
MSSAVRNGLQKVRHSIQELTQRYPHQYSKKHARLIAVSKLKPSDMILSAYKECGQMDFGENYVQELIRKSNDPLLTNTATDIRWHMIGHLQSNKCNQLLKQCPNLYCVHTVDSIKTANALNKACINSGRYKSDDDESSRNNRLRVLIQVNTSGEQSKSGCQPDESLSIYQHVLDECQALQAIGLMTIGRLDTSSEQNRAPDDDFQLLVKCKEQIINTLAASHDINADDFELSMGMSSDYDIAMKYGATMIRIGSAIFGSRDYPVAADKSADTE